MFERVKVVNFGGSFLLRIQIIIDTFIWIQSKKIDDVSLFVNTSVKFWSSRIDCYGVYSIQSCALLN